MHTTFFHLSLISVLLSTLVYSQSTSSSSPSPSSSSNGLKSSSLSLNSDVSVGFMGTYPLWLVVGMGVIVASMLVGFLFVAYRNRQGNPEDVLSNPTPTPWSPFNKPTHASTPTVSGPTYLSTSTTLTSSPPLPLIASVPPPLPSSSTTLSKSLSTPTLPSQLPLPKSSTSVSAPSYLTSTSDPLGSGFVLENATTHFPVSTPTSILPVSAPASPLPPPSSSFFPSSSSSNPSFPLQASPLPYPSPSLLQRSRSSPSSSSSSHTRPTLPTTTTTTSSSLPTSVPLYIQSKPSLLSSSSSSSSLSSTSQLSDKDQRILAWSKSVLTPLPMSLEPASFTSSYSGSTTVPSASPIKVGYLQPSSSTSPTFSNPASLSSASSSSFYGQDDEDVTLAKGHMYDGLEKNRTHMGFMHSKQSPEDGYVQDPKGRVKKVKLKKKDSEVPNEDEVKEEEEEEEEEERPLALSRRGSCKKSIRSFKGSMKSYRDPTANDYDDYGHDDDDNDDDDEDCSPLAMSPPSLI